VLACEQDNSGQCMTLQNTKERVPFNIGNITCTVKVKRKQKKSRSTIINFFIYFAEIIREIACRSGYWKLWRVLLFVSCVREQTSLICNLLSSKYLLCVSSNEANNYDNHEDFLFHYLISFSLSFFWRALLV
jgi:hypothetical protein